MTDDLLELAIATTGGRELWKTLCGLRIDISIGGPIWAMKRWPPEKTFDQILTLDTVKEHIVFTPFTRPDAVLVGCLLALVRPVTSPLRRSRCSARNTSATGSNTKPVGASKNSRGPRAATAPSRSMPAR
jgi:hypothetical protein